MTFRTTCAAALLTLAATGASAAITSQDFEAYEGSITGNLIASTEPDFSDNFSFTWSNAGAAEGAPYQGAFTFTSDSRFDLALGEVSGDYGEDDVSAFTLDRIMDGSFERQNAANTCPNAGQLAGNCSYFSEVGSDEGNAADALKEGELLFSGLEAGEYSLGLIESASPANGSAGFDYRGVAAVPVPAGGLLLLGGLGAIGALRRRKHAA
ncbi:hypothetical protein OCH239_15615 [Roseivivax halodurans JCM 10272]|uniref:PEP-CTERM protein-sorting domain-containing protein n=1 Tax=Roseivivax halodurans JCM 10272 TaxID=1449350 RepID=X7ECD5_9RHOB|nr:VPLPA-CTERM sorting domain-containing protein [Roseivivax halodurans]ETX12851.1 hypothetical protein OCH239_15615 [Roseivivax halodurans JCM 10272]